MKKMPNIKIPELIDKIAPLMCKEEPDVMSSLQILSEHFGKEYSDTMRLTDWITLLNTTDWWKLSGKNKEVTSGQLGEEDNDEEYGNTTKAITNRIAKKHRAFSIPVVIEQTKSRVPNVFLKYIMENDYDVYLKMMETLSDDTYTIDGTVRQCKIYVNGKTKIKRFFINNEVKNILSKSAKGRWANDLFCYNEDTYCITNQIDGHDIESKNNVRINDYALFIYEASCHKYFINFIEKDDGRSSKNYLHELRKIDETKDCDSLENEDNRILENDKIIAIEHPLSFYTNLFSSLNCSKKRGQTAPHKAIMLLTVISEFESGVLVDEFVPHNDRMVEMFEETWKKYVSKSSFFKPSFATPFYHLSSEPFWNILPVSRFSFMTGISTVGGLRKHYKGAQIHSELAEYMKIATCRHQLKRALIDKYFPNWKDEGSHETMEEIDVTSDNSQSKETMCA